MDCPLLLEINTRCWLAGLSDRAGHELSLANVPESEFKRWQELGFTHLWLMGVWTTSARSRSHALEDEQLRVAYDELLPGWQPRDIPGSPFAIGHYEVSPHLGGNAALQKFRKILAAHGLKLILDFVPNHFGLDHSWVTHRPDWLVTCDAERPGTFHMETVQGPRWIALAKDPNFPAWPDVVQIDYRVGAVRAEMVNILRSIARLCDGVRCDMAMLVLNDVFARTWSDFPINQTPPASEFWTDAIAAVRGDKPDFVFLAEAYWGLESRLQAMGFDFTYDKHVYDCLVNRSHRELQRHVLQSPLEYTQRSAHFLENHDEPRIATCMSPGEQRAAALVVLGLPGMRFLHDGQLTGMRHRIPVQMGRYAAEHPDPEVVAVYDKLLNTLKDSCVGSGTATPLPALPAWEGNPTAQEFVVVQWQKAPLEFELVVANLAPHRSQCRVQLTVPELGQHDWEMIDRLGDEAYVRPGAELQEPGLFLDLPPHGAQLFRFTPQKKIVLNKTKKVKA